MGAGVWVVPNSRVEAELDCFGLDREGLPVLGFKPGYGLVDEWGITMLRLVGFGDRMEAERDGVLLIIGWRSLHCFF